jgi:hypothetical protein
MLNIIKLNFSLIIEVMFWWLKLLYISMRSWLQIFVYVKIYIVYMYIDVSHKYNTQTCRVVMNSFKCFIEKSNIEKSIKN